MENNSAPKNEETTLTKIDANLLTGASQVKLTEDKRKALCAPFEDLDYEIHPDGYVYLPAVFTLERLNNVIGIGQWTLWLIDNYSESIGQDQVKEYYDGALLINGAFASRSMGEGTWYRNNTNQSRATGLEAAKTVCRERCCKDLGIDSKSRNPSWVRKWKSDHAVRVHVNEEKGKGIEIKWRRKDLEPLEFEICLAPTGPTVPQAETSGRAGLPWLNTGVEYDAFIKQLIDGTFTLAKIREKYRLSRSTEDAVVQAVKDGWKVKLENCIDRKAVTALYNSNPGFVDSFPGLRDVFSARQNELKSLKVA